jgi:NADPH:quinone reductase
MRALRVHELGAPPRLDEVPVPEPGEDEVLVRLEATVIGHHDLGVAAGVLPVFQPLPYVPGLEGAGRTVDDDAPVRVFGGGLGSTRPGTWAEYVVAPAAAVTPVPVSLPPALAAACGSSANTAWAALHDAGAIGDGESVGVTGATGAVGSLVVQLAGGRRVVAWTRSPERVQARAEVLRDDEDPAEPVDLLIDTVGGPLLPRRLRSIRAGGRAVLLGYTAGERVELELPALMHGDVSLLPLNMRRRRVPPEVTAQLLDDFAAGRLTVATDVVGLDELNKGIGRLKAGRAAGRLVLAW